MKKIILFVISGSIITLLPAAERTVDTDFLSAPRTAYSLMKDSSGKKNSVGLDIRNRDAITGMVILNNGKFRAHGSNLVYELQIGNLKRVKLRTASGAPSLAWATYDVNGEICRLGPVAQLETSGAVDPKSMAKYEIVFLPQEKVFCFSCGKAVRGKMKILYFTDAGRSGDAEK